VAFYALLDELAARHPGVAWETCAGGGGRIDLEVLGRTSRAWASDNTDALARQAIQRWTTLLVAPEYLGAHVSAPVSHQTGRALPLDFRAATALFCGFGIEWDLTSVPRADLARLGAWVDVFKQFRPLLHAGRTVRPDSSDPAVLLHGVVADDRAEALVAHVQLDESAHARGVMVRVPHLAPGRSYRLAWVGPGDDEEPGSGLDRAGPSRGGAVRGAVLASSGVWVPRRRPHTVTLIHVRAVPT
jgi:alpha-galactosidase